MKFIFTLALSLSAILSYAQTEDNQELAQLYAEGDLDHSSWSADYFRRKKRDSIRKEQAIIIFENIESPTSKDYEHLASFYSGSLDSMDNEKMIGFMEKAIALDPNCDRTLYAHGIDSRLVRQGKPQIYGTQSYIDLSVPKGQLSLYEVDTTQVSDAQRVAFGLPTLEEKRAELKLRTTSPFMDKMAEGMNVPELIELCRNEFKEDPSSFFVKESSLRLFAHRLNLKKNQEDALKVYELWAELYPDSFNAFDALGNHYFTLEQYEKGVNALKQSLRLNPQGYFAQRMLEEHNN